MVKEVSFKERKTVFTLHFTNVSPFIEPDNLTLAETYFSLFIKFNKVLKCTNRGFACRKTQQASGFLIIVSAIISAVFTDNSL